MTSLDTSAALVRWFGYRPWLTRFQKPSVQPSRIATGGMTSHFTFTLYNAIISSAGGGGAAGCSKLPIEAKTTPRRAKR